MKPGASTRPSRSTTSVRASGVELAGSADRRDAVAGDGDVGVADRRAGPVDECGSAEQEIHRHPVMTRRATT